MPLLRRNKDQNLIPPVEPTRSVSPVSTTSSLPSYRSNNSTYVASRDGDLDNRSPYGNNRSYPENRYDDTPRDGQIPARYRGLNTSYGANDEENEANRNALFSGYNPERSTGLNRFRDATTGPPRRPTPPPGEEEEEDVEAIKTQTRLLKQDTASSTRNALRLAQEAEETARNTLNRLGAQSEKIASTERHLDISKGHALRAEDNTDELKQLNRSIFIPVTKRNNNTRRRKEEEKRQQRFEEDRDERERAFGDSRESQNRIGRAAGYGRDDDESIRPSRNDPLKKAQRSRFQFEATQSDDDLEDEIDENLDAIAGATSRLKALGVAMNQELEQQNTRIERIAQKTDKLDNRVQTTTDRLKRIK